MKRCWMVLGSVGLVLLLAGCGPSNSKPADETPAAAQKQGAGNPLTAPVDYLGAVGAAQKQAARTVDMTSLTQAVRAFQAGEDRLPNTLQELVSEGYLPRLPAPPKGSQWAYQPQSGRVALVPAPAPPLPPSSGTPKRP